MKKTWLLLADRFDALQPRERVILFVGALVIVLGAFYVFVLDRAWMQYQLANKSMQQSDKTLNALREQELALSQLTAETPDQQAGRSIAEMRRINAATRDRLAGASMPLVGPDKMRTVLTDLIAAQDGLQLVSARSLPPEDLLADSSAAASAPRVASAQSLYRQSLELTVQGDYRALAEYLRKVEGLPWKVQVGSVSLRSESYPRNSLKVVLHTLSLERSWIGL
ncbi:type II secretion system protein GspM [Uliginosibacterium sp. H3]|uniref:Type II secretion system protein GspM n=1 Tax=Uliginosibacterium silvisoli TaxID=3114758 RepID=A0ABU6K3A9_9RHOO|nr:type II secretion system protein GspM [Uliginosibacterium sp. H3]